MEIALFQVIICCNAAIHCRAAHFLRVKQFECSMSSSCPMYHVVTLAVRGALKKYFCKGCSQIYIFKS